MTGPGRDRLPDLMPGPAGPLRSAVYLFAAVVVSLWVVFANGGPTFYFDSGAFLERGGQLVSMLGLDPPDVPDSAVILTQPEAALSAPGPEAVEGSRAMSYSLLFGLFLVVGFVEGITVLNALLSVGTLWLVCSVMLRDLPRRYGAAAVTLGATVLASLGAQAFYVAFLMPDIFMPVLILLLALLLAYGSRMRLWELAVAFGLGAFAVSVHLSHLAVASMAVPIAIAVALSSFRSGSGFRRWRATVLIGLIAVAGISEQAALRMAAKQTFDAEVIYRPFLTARLIQDGPGLSYLEDQCPDAAEPSCALLDALSASDDPDRLSATNISFSSDPETGSYRLLPVAQQIAVAQDQFDFFFRVIADRPVESLLALSRNAARQLVLVDVDMTLQTDAIVAVMSDLPGLAYARFDHGRLTASLNWLDPVRPAQWALYLVSAAFVVWLIVTRRVPGAVAMFLSMVLLGILGNAIVTGGLSQPALRYGARVVWLLPAIAAVGGAAWLSGRSSPSGSGGAT